MKGDIFAYLILSSSFYFLQHIRALITVWPSSGNNQVEITSDNHVTSLNGALLTLEIAGALKFERTESTDIKEEVQCTFLLDRIESIDIAIVQPSNHSSTLRLLFEQHPFFSIYTVGVQVALKLRALDGQVTLEAESCQSFLNTHIQLVMRQVMDTAMPPHIQLTRSVCQKHYSKANGNEQQVCFSEMGPPLSRNKIRKAAARLVRMSVDDQDIATSLNSTLYETGVSELFTSISLRRNGNLAYTREPWSVNMVHAWSKSDKSINLCKHLIEEGLVRVVLRLDPLMYRNIIPAMVSPASPIISSGQLQPIAGRFSTLSANAEVTLVGHGFHQEYRIRLHLATVATTISNYRCETHSNWSIRLFVPISNDMYLDLDELRRLERFGKLTFQAFSKYIDIERPSSVSVQQFVSLTFSINPTAETDTFDFQFPIHMRYQTPSLDLQYRNATILPTDIFLSCLPLTSPRHNAIARTTSFSTTPLIVVKNSASGEEDLSQSLSWFRVALQSQLESIQLSVPVGYLPDGKFVTGVTFSVTFVGAMLLVAAVLWKSPHQDYRKIH